MHIDYLANQLSEIRSAWIQNCTKAKALSIDLGAILVGRIATTEQHKKIIDAKILDVCISTTGALQFLCANKRKGTEDDFSLKPISIAEDKILDLEKLMAMDE